jgi:hypothetical protein
VLRSSYSFRPGRGPATGLTVRVEDPSGKPWPARTIQSQSDLAYAMKDALATNTLAEGVLRASLQPGSPVVVLFKPAVVRLPVGAASDFFRHHLEPAAYGASAVFNRNVSGFLITSTIRDPQKSS